MMPAIHSMRLAVRPSRSALMIGMPPATAASKATMTPFFCAAAKISVPCEASSALFAVTTCLPFSIAFSISSFAIGIAADQLDNDVDVGIRDHFGCVAGHDDVIARDFARLLDIAIGNHPDDDTAARPACDFFLIALENGKSAAADGADA